jgi:D-serine deaminase-like pyridoxal phosphate-dependent protein
MEPWLRSHQLDQVRSPALLVDPDRVRANTARMIAIAGGAERLMPHVKTHKSAAITRIQQEAGIQRFKCATLSEAAMLGRCGVAEVLIAMQPAGPMADGVAELAREFPGISWSVLADDEEVLPGLARACRGLSQPLGVMVDLNVGMDRTGVRPGDKAFRLYERIASTEGLRALGLHAYDGHIVARDLSERLAASDAAFEPVTALAKRLREAGHAPRIIAGGTPTFPAHARRAGVTLSPGTCVLWDAGYESKLPDLHFEPAAALLTRVISKPGEDRICLDLGHKAVASEMPQPRVVFPELGDAELGPHSEEHLVARTAEAGRFRVGDSLIGIPWHICPTVALHAEYVVAKDGKEAGRWRVDARDRVP